MATINKKFNIATLVIIFVFMQLELSDGIALGKLGALGGLGGIGGLGGLGGMGCGQPCGLPSPCAVQPPCAPQLPPLPSIDTGKIFRLVFIFEISCDFSNFR